MPTEPAQDFDFLYGDWHVRNRKLVDVTDPARDEWVEFDATSEAFPVLDGYGHVDRMYVPNPPDGDPFEGFTLRLFDPATRKWSIWWSSTRMPGHLDVPVVGEFHGSHGVFEAADEVGGRPVKMRFEWRADLTSPVWQQSFSYDEGRTWTLNWTMQLTRRSGGSRASLDR